MSSRLRALLLEADSLKPSWREAVLRCSVLRCVVLRCAAKPAP
jgi:hypothetical protein